MKLTKSPADFASAMEENYFSFEEVEPSEHSEVIFYDESDNVVAVRRFVGCECINTSPKAFLLHRLAPEPVVEGCGFMKPVARDASLSVEYDYGNEITPLILFTAAHQAYAANSAMGAKEQWRTIAPAERDEIGFCVMPQTTVEAYFSADGEVFTLLESFTPDFKGVLLFVLSTEDLVARSLLAEGTKEFMVRFTINRKRCTTLHYRLADVHPTDVRLAWLNKQGGVSYHTFHAPVQQRLRTHSIECETPNGSVVMEKQSWVESRLDSGELSEGEAHILAELLTSPRLWRVGAEGCEPQIILSSEGTMAAGKLRRVSLTIRPAQKTKLS